MSKTNTKKLGAGQRSELLETLSVRFEKNMERHVGIQWSKVQARMEAAPDKLWTLHEMERTGGEPDVVGRFGKAGAFIFHDCSAESPKGRRSLCYDEEALEARKKHKPKGSAVEMATAMGAALLTEDGYRYLQGLGDFDTRTSSWLQTPSDIRALGGALFGDVRYGTIFTYHNGADSYYAARGFRCSLEV